MITRDEITLIGKFNKPHGINGEISATVNVPLEVLDECSCIVCDIDGIFVPFFIDAIRTKSHESALITLDGIASEQEAMMVVNKDIYILEREQIAWAQDNEEVPVEFFVNFKARINGTLTGTVAGLDDTTANVLLVIDLDNGSEVLIPAVDEFITSIDFDQKVVTFNIPQEFKKT